MDVSDFEGGGQEGDDERTIIEEDTLQPMESERTYNKGAPGSGGSGGSRTANGPVNHSSNQRQSKHGGPPPHPQPRQSPTGGGAYSNHAPLPPNRSSHSPNRHSPNNAHQTPYYSANNRRVCQSLYYRGFGMTDMVN